MQVPSFNELESMSLKQISSTYTGLRDIFNKRMVRLEKTGNRQAQLFVSGNAPFGRKIGVIKNQPYLKNAGTEALRQALIRETQDVINLLGAPSGGHGASASSLSIMGLRKQRKDINSKISESLRQSGYDKISPGMIKKFGRFMDAMREQYGYKLKQSILMVEFFDSLKYSSKRKGLSDLVDLWKDFEANDYQPTNENIYLFRS